ncbi:hypothetical protein ATO13_23346 [Stappia sp. 22II-S9-Z10]|nr:hypothetical protein ATO13_23346 [Stappia sp. 22II-S9-Z10]
MPDVRGADARSAQIGGPDSISQCFQVSAYRGEPAPAIAACNLLAKDDWRAALRDEISPDGPQVPLVFDAPALAGRAERLARATSGPDGPLVRPSGEPECESPTADPGEEMALSEAAQVI